MENSLYQKYFIDYFNSFEDDILIEMASIHPLALRRMCVLINLDLQLELERLDKKNEVVVN